MGKVFKPKRSDNGERYEYWYFKYKDIDGIWKKAKGYKDKKATEAAMRAKEKEVEEDLAGIHRSRDNRRLDPIAGLIAEWVADVELHSRPGKRSTAAGYKSIVNRFVQLAGWKTLASITMEMPTRSFMPAPGAGAPRASIC